MQYQIIVHGAIGFRGQLCVCVCVCVCVWEVCVGFGVLRLGVDTTQK